MNCSRSNCAKRDLVGSRLALLVWCVPSLLIVIGIVWSVARSWLWIPSFTVMGLACFMNARRCGRLHCHFTGPLFLFAAGVTALDQLAVTSLGWRLVLAIVSLGTGLAYALEWVRGKYVKHSLL